jgi:hypothetical protein
MPNDTKSIVGGGNNFKVLLPYINISLVLKYIRRIAITKCVWVSMIPYRFVFKIYIIDYNHCKHHVHVLILKVRLVIKISTKARRRSYPMDRLKIRFILFPILPLILLGELKAL